MKKKHKPMEIVLLSLIAVGALSIFSMIIGQTIAIWIQNPPNWYDIFIVPILLVIIFLLTPFCIAIGYEGTNISALSPSGMPFWFWLAIFLIFASGIALAILTHKKEKLKS